MTGNTRMTGASVAAIKVADHIRLVGFESRPGAADWRYAIHGTAQGRIFQVFGADGFARMFPNLTAAEIAVRRHNKAVPIEVEYHRTAA